SLRAPGGHGEYLRTHLRLTADGERIEARLLAANPPSYELEYRWTGPRPQRLELSQESREAVYVVRVSGPAPAAREGLLLRSGAPLSLLPDRREGWAAG